jgi:hypothetical protein
MRDDPVTRNLLSSATVGSWLGCCSLLEAGSCPLSKRRIRHRGLGGSETRQFNRNEGKAMRPRQILCREELIPLELVKFGLVATRVM